jgi:hypothetical protein
MIAIVAVTQDDIDRGVPADAEHCPIARALCRRFHLGEGEVFVGPAEIMFSDGDDGRPVEPPLPPRARKFVDDFDHCQPVSPFTFVIDVPDTLGSAA